MYKTYLNEKELELIKGADRIVEKIGGFSSMENERFESFSVKRSEDNRFRNDVELVYDITGWLETLDFYLTHAKDVNDPHWDPYRHKAFEERHIRIFFHNCFGLKLTGFPLH